MKLYELFEIYQHTRNHDLVFVLRLDSGVSFHYEDGCIYEVVSKNNTETVSEITLSYISKGLMNLEIEPLCDKED